MEAYQAYSELLSERRKSIIRDEANKFFETFYTLIIHKNPLEWN